MAGVRPATPQKRPRRTDSESTLSFIPTMQPTLLDEPPSGDQWLHEIKYDGYRTQLVIENSYVRAFTRNGHNWTERYDPVVRDAATLPCRSAIIDGEICVQNEQGVTDFAALRGAIGQEPHRLMFFAFDLLHLEGEDLRRQPLEERRAKLRFLLAGAPGRIHLSDEFDGDGHQFFSLVDQLGLEGIVSKRKGSRYSSGRVETWVKVKCWHTDTFDVIGVEKDRDGVPFALLADAEGYKGAAFIALPAALRDVFWRYVEGRSAEKPSIKLPKRAEASWVRPGMKASVRFLKGSDKLRHATMQAIEVER
jgi:bifunctional non-homologous end joining protein LigD